MRCRLIFGIVCFAAIATACTPLTRSSREKQLNEAVDSLLPREAHVLARRSGDCTTLAGSPSCLTVYYVSGNRKLRARERTAARAARESGWSLLMRHAALGGNALVFERGQLRATFELWAKPRYRRCLAAPSSECADFLQVVRR